MYSLSNKVALITGAASGIGLAIARIFKEHGAIVYNLDINRQGGEEIQKTEGIFFKHLDISNQSEVIQTINTIHSEHGKVDILVNNAGIAHVGNVESTEEQDFDTLIDVNVKGVYNCLKAVIPLFRKGGGGNIINIASIAASVGLADRFLYSATKAAVLNMSLTIAKDYIAENIRCNSISPARIHTSFVDNFVAKYYPDSQEEKFEELSKTQPIGRMGQPIEVAQLALFLASDASAFITGTDYPIDGGFIKLNT